LVVEADSEFMAEANQANILSLGEMEAYKFRHQATMENYKAGIEAGRYRSGASETIRQGTIAGQALTAQAGVSRYQAGATIRAGQIGAATTIMGGYYQTQTAKNPNLGVGSPLQGSSSRPTTWP
jgi:hypothetical protein